MIEAHTFDAWTSASSRGSTAFGYAMILAGFAAPLFLWLAGVAIPLAASAGKRRGLTRREAGLNVVKRGLEIFILAFLFRIQAFVLSPGAHPITLFRVDILNVMGPGIVLAALVWLVVQSRTSAVVLFSVLAAAVTMTTPIIRHLEIVDRLPPLLQWYIRPSGDNTTFTSFPWIGFVFAGAAVGSLLAGIGDKRIERRQLAAIGIAGLVAIAGGFVAASQPSIYADSSFWTSSPAYFAIRAGLMMTTLALMFALDEAIVRRFAPLEMLARLGRSSLFIYWIHVELVYGYASWAIHRRLPLWATAIAFLLFSLSVYTVLLLRDRVAKRWRTPAGPIIKSAPIRQLT